jgi:thiol:disulfide interchange protein
MKNQILYFALSVVAFAMLFLAFRMENATLQMILQSMIFVGFVAGAYALFFREPNNAQESISENSVSVSADWIRKQDIHYTEKRKKLENIIIDASETPYDEQLVRLGKYIGIQETLEGLETKTINIA